jgi:hypothetical protein
MDALRFKAAGGEQSRFLESEWLALAPASHVLWAASEVHMSALPSSIILHVPFQRLRASSGPVDMVSLCSNV